MADCGNNVDLTRKKAIAEDRIPKADLDARAKVVTMVGMIQNDPLVRMGIGEHPGSKGDAGHMFRNWAISRIGPGGDPKSGLSNADVNHLYAEMIRIKDSIGRLEKWDGSDQSHVWLNRLLFLPQDVFRRDIPGGERYFARTQRLRSMREQARTFMGDALTDLSTKIESLTNVDRKLVASVLEPAEAAVGRARQDLRELQNAPIKDAAMIREAKLKVQAADTAYQKVLRGEITDKKVGDAIRMLRATALLLEGKYVDTSGGTEKILPFKTSLVNVDEARVDSGLDIPDGDKMPIWITERRVNSEQLNVHLDKVFGDPEKSDKIRGIARATAKGFLHRFGELAREGFKAERENMIYKLLRSGPGLTRAEASRMVDASMHLTIEDLYFPRQSMEAKARLERMSMAMETASDVKGLMQLAADDPTMFTIPGESTPHVLERVYSDALSDTSYNMLNVLSSYGSKMIDYWHNNHLALESNRLLDRLWEVHKTIKSPDDAKRFEGYVDGVSKYIADFVDRSKNTPQGGKMYEAMKTVVAWKAAMTMGFLNPSSPVLNALEGQLLVITRSGAHYATSKQKELEWQRLVSDFGIGREHTSISESDIMGVGGTPFRDGRMGTNLSNADRRRMGLVEMDNERKWAAKISGAVSEFAKKSIVLQRMAENMNRARAFKVGALMEYEFIRQYEDRFLGERDLAREMMTSLEAEELGITADMLSTAAGRERAWKKFANERITKAGWEMVSQTQWNYNEVARHYFERYPIGKLAMMYQHYPLSWVSAWRRTFEVLNSLRRAEQPYGNAASSVKAMFQPTSKDSALNALGSVPGLGKVPPINSDMMFALITGSIGLTLASLRYGTGIVAGQLWNHPLSESVEDAAKYVQYGFKGEHEMKKSLFWGKGLVNNFTGPAYSDLMDAMSLGAVKAGIDDGSMPRWTADILRGTVGFRPNELLLTEYGRRNFTNAWDVMYETFLFGGISAAPKAVRLSQSIPGISEWIYGNKATLKDLSYQAVRSVGIRDDKASEAGMKRLIEKEGKP